MFRWERELSIFSWAQTGAILRRDTEEHKRGGIYTYIFYTHVYITFIGVKGERCIVYILPGGGSKIIVEVEWLLQEPQLCAQAVREI